MLQRTNIYLDPKTIDFLKRRANQKGVSMAQFIRKMLEQGIEKENKPSGNWAESLLKSTQKVRRSGLKDVATRHDYYLFNKK